MEDDLQTLQFQDLDEEQLQAVTGGGMLGYLFTPNWSKGINETMHQENPGVIAKTVANMAANKWKTSIRESAEAGKKFKVRKSWTKPLTRLRADT